jgi:hypothetical protein
MSIRVVRTRSSERRRTPAAGHGLIQEECSSFDSRSQEPSPFDTPSTTARNHTLKKRSEQSKLWMSAVDPVRALLMRVQHQQQKKNADQTSKQSDDAVRAWKERNAQHTPPPNAMKCRTIPDQPRVHKVNDTVATVLGCGGGGICLMIAGELLRRGCASVRLYDIDPEARRNAPGLVMNRLSQHVREGLLLPHDVPVMHCRLQVCDKLDSAIMDTNLVVECVSEHIETKRRAFADVSAACTKCDIQPESLILCTNTIGVPLADIAEAVSSRYSPRLMGMRFLFPFYFVDEVELLMNPKWCRFSGLTERLNSSQPAMHAAEQMLRRMGFRPVRNTNIHRPFEEIRALTAAEARLFCDRQRIQCRKDAAELGVILPQFMNMEEEEILHEDGSTTPTDERSTPSSVSETDDEPRWSRAPGGACAANDYTQLESTGPRLWPSCWKPI